MKDGPSSREIRGCRHYNTDSLNVFVTELSVGCCLYIVLRTKITRLSAEVEILPWAGILKGW